MKVRSVLTDRDARGDGKDTAELLAQCRIRCDELTAELSATEIERAKTDGAGARNARNPR